MKETFLTKIVRLVIGLAVVVLTAVAGNVMWKPQVAEERGAVWEAVRRLPEAEPLMVNVNTASERELEELPGIGPELAKRIVEEREANGPFETTDDLQRVSGIGEGKMSEMAEYITTK